MKKIDTGEGIRMAVEKGVAALKELGVSISEDEWTIVQPLSKGNAIITMMEEDEDGNRVMRQLINDCVVVLPAIEGTLDVFN